MNSRLEPSLCEPQPPFPGNGILRAETKAPEKRLRFEWPSEETTRTHGSPQIRGYSQRAGKSLFARDCVVGLGGLELRANHAVAIEPISGRGHLADFLRSNVADLPKNPPERTGNQLQKERYYRKFRAPRGAAHHEINDLGLSQIRFYRPGSVWQPPSA
jgi:hypothetical protein